jgi:hypothetical protein
MAEQTKDLLQTITLDRLRELLQRFGYRAELVTVEAQKTTFLRSATAGMAFDIRPGNRLPGDTDAYADFSFLALFTIKGGELPWAIVNNWNNQRRFGRLHIDQGFLMLDMDVSVAGGVSAEHLSAQFVIWDQLLQGLITYLRTELPRYAANAGAGVPVVDAQQPAVTA